MYKKGGSGGKGLSCKNKKNYNIGKKVGHQSFPSPLMAGGVDLGRGGLKMQFGRTENANANNAKKCRKKFNLQGKTGFGDKQGRSDFLAKFFLSKA